MKFGAIQNTSASSSCTSIRVCCFLALKLFHQIVDFFLCRTFELCKFSVNVIKTSSFKFIVSPSTHPTHQIVREFLNYQQQTYAFEVWEVQHKHSQIHPFLASCLIASSRLFIVETSGSSLLVPP